MPPPRTTSAMSVTAAIGAMWSAIRRASSSTTSRAISSPRARRSEDRRARRTAAAASCSRRSRPRAARRAPRPPPRTDRSPRRGRPRRGRPRRRRRYGRGAARRAARGRRRGRCRPTGTTKSSTPRAMPCHCSPTAARLMSFSTVTGSSSRVELVRRSRRPRGPATFVGELEPPGLARRRRPARRRRRRRSGRRAGPSPPRARAREARRSPSIAPLGVGAVELDVLPRTDLAAQVADRAAQEARAQVEPEHEPRLGHGLEEDGAVGRPPGSGFVSRTRPASSSDWSASETVGFEIPARREISAREIGAPERIASSTVRSFRSLRSGGIAALRLPSWK